jgi:hypothetical protein
LASTGCSHDAHTNNQKRRVVLLTRIPQIVVFLAEVAIASSFPAGVLRPA